MAGVLNFRPLPISRAPCHLRASRSRFSITASSDHSESASTSTRASTAEEKGIRVSSSSPPPPISAPPNFKPPQPKPFNVRPDRVFDVLGAAVALIFRFGTGVFVSGHSASFVLKNEIPPDQYALEIAGYKLKETSKVGPRPEKPIEIYEFERYFSHCNFFVLDLVTINGCGLLKVLGCQLISICSLLISFLPCNCFLGCDELNLSSRVLFSKLGSSWTTWKLQLSILSKESMQVREIVAVLDLDILFYPCPRNGPNFRPKVGRIGGKQQFPYMVDQNTGVAMYESDEIIKYLVERYGDGRIPFMLSLGLLTTLTEGLAMIGRMGRGSSYTPSKLPPKPLEVWAYEGSPFCKIVREVLVELELPHVLRRLHHQHIDWLIFL